MNRQGPNGIEYCDYTWNPVTGCRHRCRWRMPNDEIATCYAEDFAHGVARKMYPQGFAHHTYHPDRLDEPLRVKTPARIFAGSMADLFGHWVPPDQVLSILEAMGRAHWHTFLVLTKHAPGLLKYQNAFPPNVWKGVSLPPTFMHGQELAPASQRRMFWRALDVLAALPGIRWVSFEPLSFDVMPMLRLAGEVPFEWAVIGAASHGREKFQPHPAHVEALLEILDEAGVAVFFKGNLDWEPRRAAFPRVAFQMALF